MLDMCADRAIIENDLVGSFRYQACSVLRLESLGLQYTVYPRALGHDHSSALELHIHKCSTRTIQSLFMTERLTNRLF